jgi:two-component system, LytTR family, sensor kinase
MKSSSKIILQIVIWLVLYITFVNTGRWHQEGGLSFYLLNLVKLSLLIALYHGFSSRILPFYFQGKKQFFWGLTIAVFIVFVFLYVFNDSLIREALMNNMTNQEDIQRMKKIPFIYIIWSPILLGVAILGVATASRGIEEADHRKEAVAEANKKRLEAELTLLKSQINPHFIVNILNNLYGLSLSDPQKTPEAILKLSDMMKYVLYETSKEKGSIQKEIEFISSYLYLQKMRLPPNLKLTTSLPINLSANAEVEPMILMPLIENTFKHGMTAKSKTEIIIELKYENNLLSLFTSNENYTPLNPDQEGMGLSNVKKRLLNTYPSKHTFDYGMKEGRYTTDLKIDLS